MGMGRSGLIEEGSSLPLHNEVGFLAPGDDFFELSADAAGAICDTEGDFIFSLDRGEKAAERERNCAYFRTAQDLANGDSRVTEKIMRARGTRDVIKKIAAEKLKKTRRPEGKAARRDEEFLEKEAPLVLKSFRGSGVTASDAEIERALHENIKAEHEIQIRQRLAEVLADKAREEYNQKYLELLILREEGKLSEAQFAEKRDEILEEAVSGTDDEELKQMWEGYLVQSDYVEGLTEEHPTEMEITDPAELQQAFGEIEGVQFGYAVSHINGNKGLIELDDDFSVRILAFKDLKTKRYIYYFEDAFANTGKVGPFMAPELSRVAFHRQIDAYLTRKISPFLEDSQSIADVRDEKLVYLGERLLWPGLKIEGEGRMVLDLLAKLLIRDDQKFTSLSKKVEFLAEFVRKDANLTFLRNALLHEPALSVSDIAEGRLSV